MTADPVEIRLGVFLEEVAPVEEPADRDLDETGHAPAAGYRGEHRNTVGRRVALAGEDVLRAAAEAVGREVASVVAGVVRGIEQRGPAATGGSFDVGDVELKFGVKATLGAGKAIEALLTATGEATVEVTLQLRQRSVS